MEFIDLASSTAASSIVCCNLKVGEMKLQDEGGGAGVYSVDLWKSFQLSDDSWKYDKVPEIMDGPVRRAVQSAQASSNS